MMRTLLVMLALIAAFLPSPAPVRAAVPSDCHHVASEPHQAPHHPQPTAPPFDQHGCIGCAVPLAELQLPLAGLVPPARPAVLRKGFVARALTGLDPPPPRHFA